MVSQKYFVCATDGTIWIPRVRFFAGRHHLQWGPKVNGLSCIQYMGATWINSKPLPGIILIPSVCNFFHDWLIWKYPYAGISRMLEASGIHGQLW